MTTTRKLIFIVYFGPALLFFPLGVLVTAARLAYALGRDYAVNQLAENLARKKGGAA